MHLGRGHTKGDTIVWLPKEKILFSGDLVEYAATPYTGDAYLRTGRARSTAARFKPKQLVPGRGEALSHACTSRGWLEGHARLHHANVRVRTRCCGAGKLSRRYIRRPARS